MTRDCEDIDLEDIGLNPNVGSKGRAAGKQPRHGQPSTSLQAHHRDTPPRDVIRPRQVSWLAGPCFRPAFPEHDAPVTRNGRQLTAHSCGGSSGIGVLEERRTGFPLSSGASRKARRTTTSANVPRGRERVKIDIKTCLYRNLLAGHGVVYSGAAQGAEAVRGSGKTIRRRLDFPRSAMANSCPCDGSVVLCGCGGTGRRAGLKKRFVYQSTGKHDELKTACFQGFASEGEMAADIRFSL